MDEGLVTRDLLNEVDATRVNGDSTWTLIRGNEINGENNIAILEEKSLRHYYSVD